MDKYYIIIILVAILLGILIWQLSKNSTKSKFNLLPMKFGTKYVNTPVSHLKENLTLGIELPLKFNTIISKSVPIVRRKYGKSWLTCQPETTEWNDPARLPAFDSRDVWPGCISRIYTQGLCGSCWAFASTTALASRFCIATCHYDNEPPNQIVNTCYSSNTLNRKAQAVLRELRKVQVKRESNCICTIASAIAPDKQQLQFPTWRTYYEPSAIALINGKATKTDTKRLDDLFKVIDQQAVQKPEVGDAPEVAHRAIKQAFLYFDINGDGMIDIQEWQQGHLYGPIPLSVQVPITCILSDDGSVSQAYNTACEGSTLQRAWQYLCSWGTPDENCARYTFGRAVHTKEDSRRVAEALCPQKMDITKVGIQRHAPSEWHCTRDDATFILFQALNAYIIGHGDWSCQRQFTIMREISTRGPVSAGMHIYSSFMDGFAQKNSAGGQGYWKTGEAWPPPHRAWGAGSTALIYAPQENEKLMGGHAVVIIGWGEYIDGDITVPYWIVANSWGTTWGTTGDNKGAHGLPKSFRWDKELGNGGGYFWLLRGANACGIEDLIVAGMPDVDGVVAADSTPRGLVFSDSGIPRRRAPLWATMSPK